MTETIGAKLDKYSGIAPGFDLLRVVLAASVVTWHSFGVAREAVWLDGTPGAWIFGYSILVMFFALSGFLITGSAQRLSLDNFLINRGLRIIPALAVEIILSAFVLGPIFTKLALGDYLTRPGTYSYLTNIVGLMNFHLPGVFYANRTDVVNWSLWTVPHEIMCYVIMSALILFKLTRKPSAVAMIAVTIIAAGFFFFLYPNMFDVHVLRKAVSFFLVDRGSKLYVGFLLGILIFQLRYHIPYSRWLFAGCVLLCLIVGVAGPSKALSYPVLSVLVAPALVYMTGFLGVTDLPTLPIFRRGDYSYGIYLYGMPVQQAMAAMFPTVTSPLGQLALALPAIIIFAAFSWHMIEKPILGLRKRFSFVARVRGLEDETASPPAVLQPVAPEAATTQ